MHNPATLLPAETIRVGTYVMYSCDLHTTLGRICAIDAEARTFSVDILNTDDEAPKGPFPFTVNEYPDEDFMLIKAISRAEAEAYLEKEKASYIARVSKLRQDLERYEAHQRHMAQRAIVLGF